MGGSMWWNRVARSSRLVAGGALVAAAVTLVPAAGPVHAAPITWYLQDVTFSNGTFAAGSFDYDATTNTYSNIDITTYSSPSLGTTDYGVTWADVPPM